MEDEESGEIHDEAELFAEGFISLSKLLTSEVEIKHFEDKDVRDETFVEKLWNEGKQLGTFTMNLTLTVPFFIKQMLFGFVRTEEGMASIGISWMRT